MRLLLVYGMWVTMLYGVFATSAGLIGYGVRGVTNVVGWATAAASGRPVSATTATAAGSSATATATGAAHESASSSTPEAQATVAAGAAFAFADGGAGSSAAPASAPIDGQQPAGSGAEAEQAAGAAAAASAQPAANPLRVHRGTPGGFVHDFLCTVLPVYTMVMGSVFVFSAISQRS